MKSIRVSQETDERIKKAAHTLGRSEHSIMVEALECGLPEVERRAEAWARFQASEARKGKGKP